MYVNRRTFTVRKQEEAVALLQKARTLISGQTARILISEFGPFDTMAIEFEFATLTDYEQFWSGLGDVPGMANILEQWNELIEGGKLNELWRVAE